MASSCKNTFYTLRLTDKNSFACGYYTVKSLLNQENTYSLEEAKQIMKKFYSRKRKNPSNSFFDLITKIHLFKLNTLIEQNKKILINYKQKKQ